MTNVALVVLDTLRKDYFDDHFDWLPGASFDNAWSTSHWTVPAHASLFTGKYASEVGVYANAKQFDWDEATLAERLHDSGYRTRAFSANVNVSKAFDFHRGFEEFEGSWRLRALSEDVFDWDAFVEETADRGPSRYLSALKQCVFGDCRTMPSLKRGALLKFRDLTDSVRERDDGATEALEYVRETDFDEQEFLFVNLMEAHSPYNPPSEYRTVEPVTVDGLYASLREPAADPVRIKQAYTDSVRYLSAMYRQLFAELTDDFDVILTVADHGEMLGEHGAWDHKYGLYPELTHVPLHVYTGRGETDGANSVNGADGLDDANGDDGGDPSADEIDPETELVSLLDVHRTILAVAGVDGPSRGRNLLSNFESLAADDTELDVESELEAGSVLTEYHGLSSLNEQSLADAGISRDERESLAVELNGLVIGDYYGHQTFDGFEQHGTPPFADPERRLVARVEALQKRRVNERTDVDDSVMKQLEELGYA
jgi:arylsulfatase A-like enzyme